MNRRKTIRVLIAEDDYLVSKMVKGLLEEIGYIVAGEAGNGLEAVELTQSLQPDIVLMDIKMPDMDGIQATRLIYERCPTPVVVLTAYELSDLVEQAGLAGVGAYLVKPPNIQELERAITIALARFDDMMELRRLNAELKARNEELDAFAHTVAHGLQDPLDLITTYIDLFRDEARLSEEWQGYLNIMARNGHKMKNIIQELQLLAGLRKAEVKLKPLNMARIVAEAQQRLTHLIKNYQAELRFPGYWPVVYGHAPWVEEIWTKYLSNAIIFGGQPPRVQLGSTVRSDGMVRFWVKDNGPGLTLHQQAQLFKPFIHLDPARAKGHGLGLSIVRRIVERLGGQVGVESEGIPGQGTTFTFTLPSAPD